MNKIFNDVLRFMEEISVSRREHVMKLYGVQPIRTDELTPALPVASDKNAGKLD